MNPTEISLSWLLHDVARLFRRQFELRARRESLGLTRSQAAVLAHLSRNEGINQAALAQLLDIEPITLVGLLDRLEASGMAERRPDPRDRRARALYLTDKARPALAEIQALGRRVMDDALEGVPESARAEFRRTLDRMKANLLETLDEPADDEPEKRSRRA